MVPTHYHLILSAILFTIGTMGVLLRRNTIIIFMSVELMLNAVNLSFVALAQHWGSMDGQLIVFFVMAVAAAEAAYHKALKDSRPEPALYKPQPPIAGNIQPVSLKRPGFAEGG